MSSPAEQPDKGAAPAAAADVPPKKVDKKAERKAAREAAALAAAGESSTGSVSEGFGMFMPSKDPEPRVWTPISSLTASAAGKNVWVRGSIQTVRGKGKCGFLLLREEISTVQGVLFAGGDVSKEMVKFACSLPPESVVDVYGAVEASESPIRSATQSDIELKITKIFGISKAAPELPFQIEDACIPDPEYEKDEGLVRVSQDVRLDNRFIDLRTVTNQAILRVSSLTCLLFREFLVMEGFHEIHTPKLIGGQSEGGAEVFKLLYFGRDACLAQSPQLYKQMAVLGGARRVFEIGPVFRGENSNTHRHLCEFVGLDLEMAFMTSYFEVVDLVDRMLKAIFQGLKDRCKKETEIIHRQHPAEPFKWNDETLKMSFKEACELLRVDGAEVPDDLTSFDFSTELEKRLGRIVKAKHDTDYFIVLGFPSEVRAFYSNPSEEDEKWCNSYDFYLRGEEILSGAERVIDPVVLTKQAERAGIDPKTIQGYIDAFKFGAPPHAGAGIGLERVVMLYLGLPNIRKVSLFPRDPKRLTP